MWYAEEKTDSIIYESYFAGKTNGIMVEVGAADPTYLSMSKAFKEIGWRTICVEPIPKFAKMHRDARNEIYEYALSRVMADNVTFFMQDDTDDPTAGMSYSSLEIRYNGGGNNKVKEIKVKHQKTRQNKNSSKNMISNMFWRRKND